jgi:hypothetical protein
MSKNSTHVPVPALPWTDLQGQYLAFIQAYTKVNRRPPAEVDMQRFFEVTPRRSIEWSASLRPRASFAERRERHEASSYSSLQTTSPSSDDLDQSIIFPVARY